MVMVRVMVSINIKVSVNFYQKPINRLLVLTGGKVSNNKQVT